MPGVCLGPMQITYPFLANRIRQLCLLGRFVECVGFPGLEGKPDKFSEIVFINPLPSSYRLTLCLSLFLSLCLSLYLSLCLSHRLSVSLSLCLSLYLPHERSLRHLHIFVRFLTYRRDWETATLYGKKDEAVIGISFHFV